MENTKDPSLPLFLNWNFDLWLSLNSVGYQVKGKSKEILMILSHRLSLTQVGLLCTAIIRVLGKMSPYLTNSNHLSLRSLSEDYDL